MDKKQIESFDYDTSWYNDKIDDKKKIHKFINRIRNSFITFRSVSKKQKFVYLCLATIGFVLSIAFASLANGTMTDLGYYSYSPNINTVYSETSRGLYKVLKDAYMFCEFCSERGALPVKFLQLGLHLPD